MNYRRLCAVLILALALSLVAESSYARSSGGSRGSSGHAGAPASHGTTMSVRTPPYLNTATSHVGGAGSHH